MISKYFVRVSMSDQTRFEEYSRQNNIVIEHMSNDFGPHNPTCMYSAMMDEESALALKLTFPLIGCLNFHKTMSEQVASRIKNH